MLIRFLCSAILLAFVFLIFLAGTSYKGASGETTIDPNPIKTDLNPGFVNLDKSIEDLGKAVWTDALVGQYQGIHDNINSTLKNKLINEDQAKNLDAKLTSTYIAKLNESVKNYFIEGQNTAIQTRYNELKKWYADPERKAEVEEMYLTCLDFFKFNSSIREVELIVNQDYNQSVQESVTKTLEEIAEKPYIVQHNRIQKEKGEALVRLDEHYNGSVQYERKRRDLTNTCSDIKSQYYRDKCDADHADD